MSEFETNSDPKLNQKLAQSDADALSEMDPPQEEEVPPVKPAEELPARVEKIIKEEEKETPPPPPAKPDDEPAAPKPSLTDDELKAKLEEIQPKKNAHPNTAKGYEALKDVIKGEREARKEAERKSKEFENKINSLETEYKGKVITPELEQELKDLREIRRTFQIENDPEFRSKYDTKLKDVETRAMTILKGQELPSNERLSPDIEKFIQDNGGVFGMYNSSKPMPRPYQEQTQRQFIEDTLMEKLTGVRKARFEQALAAGMDLKDEMSREIELAKTQGSERQQQKQKELQDLFNQSAEATRKSFGKLAEKLEYPDNASKEDKTKIDKHNERVAKAEKLFSEYMRDGGRSPAKLAEALARAAQSQALMEEMEEKNADIAASDKRIKDLEEKIEKMKKSGSTGGITAAPAPSSQPQPTGKFASDDAALKDF